MRPQSGTDSLADAVWSESRGFGKAVGQSTQLRELATDQNFEEGLGLCWGAGGAPFPAGQLQGECAAFDLRRWIMTSILQPF